MRKVRVTLTDGTYKMVCYPKVDSLGVWGFDRHQKQIFIPLAQTSFMEEV